MFREVAEKRRRELTLHARLGRQDKAELAFAGSLRSQRLVCTLVFVSFRGVKMARCKVCRCRSTDFPDEFQSSVAMAAGMMTSRGSPAFSSPSYALVRFDAIDARKHLCRLFPRPGERATAAPRGWLGGPHNQFCGARPAEPSYADAGVNGEPKSFSWSRPLTTNQEKFFATASVRDYPNDRRRALSYASALGCSH